MHSWTPSHHSLQLVIPGSDTKLPTFDFKSKRPPYGLETPPPSAHDESRRDSFHSLSELAFATAASARARSDPSTPVHQIIQGWSDVNVSGTSGLTRRPDRDLLSPGFSNQVYRTPAADIFPVYQHVQQSLCTNPLPLHPNSGLNAIEPWTGAVPPMTTFESSMGFLGPELFPATQSAPFGSSFTASSFHHSESPLPGHVSESEHDRALPPGLLYNEPRMMELTHADHYDHSQPEYVAFDEDDSALSRSLTSSSIAFDYDCLGPPSPMEHYIDGQSDSEDFVMVKAERVKPGTKVRQSAVRKTRSSKARRKADSAWHMHETAGIEVMCEGKKFPLNGPVNHKPGADKPHGCTYLKTNGEPCLARFARSEHLKRHVGSHTGERSYRCPIEDCVKHKTGIQRGDNAGDHFRTHLRPHKGGKRNRHVEWEWLRPAILEMWEDKKKAHKVLENLRKWIEAGMPDNTTRRNDP